MEGGVGAGGLPLRLRVKTMAPAEHAGEVAAGAGAADLRAALEPLTGVPAARQRLLFMGRALRGDGPLEAAGVADGSVLHMVELPEGAAGGVGGRGAEVPGAAPEGARSAGPQVPQLHINISAEGAATGGSWLSAPGVDSEEIHPVERLRTFTAHTSERVRAIPVIERSDTRATRPMSNYYSENDEALYDGLLHFEVQCDGCDQVPVRGRRYKSLSHSNYDLCEACHSAARRREDDRYAPYACLPVTMPSFQPTIMLGNDSPEARQSLAQLVQENVRAPTEALPDRGSETDQSIDHGLRGATVEMVANAAQEAMNTAMALTSVAADYNAGVTAAHERLADASDADSQAAALQDLQGAALQVSAMLHNASALLAETARITSTVNVYSSDGRSLPLQVSQEGYIHQMQPRLRVAAAHGGMMGTVQALIAQAQAGLQQTSGQAEATVPTTGAGGTADPSVAVVQAEAVAPATGGGGGADPAAATSAEASAAASQQAPPQPPQPQTPSPVDDASRVDEGISRSLEATGGEGSARSAPSMETSPPRSLAPSLPARKPKGKAVVKTTTVGEGAAAPGGSTSSSPADPRAPGTSSAPALPKRPAVKAKARPSAKASKRGVAARRKPQEGVPAQTGGAAADQGHPAAPLRQTSGGGAGPGAVAPAAAPMDPFASLLSGAGGGGDLMGMVSQMTQSPAFASMAGQMMGQMAGGGGSSGSEDEGMPDLGRMMEQMMPMVSQMFGGPPPGSAPQGAPSRSPASGGRAQNAAPPADPWEALTADERTMWQEIMREDRQKIRGLEIPSDLSHVYIAGDPAFIDSLGGASA